MRLRIAALIAFFALPLYLVGTASAAMGVVDWEYSFVNMRSAPSTGAKKILRIPAGTQLEIVEDKGEWLMISHASKRGWVVSRSIKPIKAPAPVAPVAQPLSATSPAPLAQAAAVKDEAQPVKRYVQVEEVGKASSGGTAPTKRVAEGAAAAVEPEQKAPTHVGMSLGDIFIAMLAALGLVGGAWWVFDRFFRRQLPQVKDSSAIRVLSSLNLNPRQALFLAEVGGEVYLLAQSEGGVDLLTKIESPEAVERLNKLLKFKANSPGAAGKGQDYFDSHDSYGDGDGGDKNVSPEERLKMLRRRPNAHEDS